MDISWNSGTDGLFGLSKWTLDYWTLILDNPLRGKWRNGEGSEGRSLDHRTDFIGLGQKDMDSSRDDESQGGSNVMKEDLCKSKERQKIWELGN